MSIMEAAWKVNQHQHKRFADQVIEYYRGAVERPTLATWGLAFKARTDDVRESPAIYCIEAFLETGMHVRVFDPEAISTARARLGDRVVYCRDTYETLEGADGLVVLTDWQQFRNPDFELVARRLRRAVMFDGRNLYDPAYVRRMGIEYHGVGRASQTGSFPAEVSDTSL